MNKHYLWINIETDECVSSNMGLVSEELLEVGVFITTVDTLKFVGACNYVITPPYRLNTLKDRLSDATMAKHTASGLLEHLQHQSFYLADAQDDMIEFIDKYGDKGDFILAGRNIPKDITYWLPKLTTRLDGERLDIAGFSAVIAAAGLSEQLEPVFEVANRAGKDAQRYFHEFLFYRELLGTVPLEVE